MDLVLLGTGAAKGNTGGGLTFVRDSTQLHYVYGIASTKLNHPKPLELFTDISNVELFSWLYNTMLKLEEAHPQM